MFEADPSNAISRLYPVIVQMFKFVSRFAERAALEAKRKRTGTAGSLDDRARSTELSKSWSASFLAWLWLFYMLTWMPWWLFLVRLRYFGGKKFELPPGS